MLSQKIQLVFSCFYFIFFWTTEVEMFNSFFCSYDFKVGVCIEIDVQKERQKHDSLPQSPLFTSWLFLLRTRGQIHPLKERINTVQLKSGYLVFYWTKRGTINPRRCSLWDTFCDTSATSLGEMITHVTLRATIKGRKAGFHCQTLWAIEALSSSDDSSTQLY